jgi:hypothetical protein
LNNCFAECFTLALGKEDFAECFFGTRQRNFFAECFLFDTRQPSAEALPSFLYLALGKAFFAERPKKRSAKPPALGKEADSGSVYRRWRTMISIMPNKLYLNLKSFVQSWPRICPKC